MKVTTPRTPVDATAGIEVAPDAAWIPVAIRVTASSPTAALKDARARVANIEAAVAGRATVRLDDYAAAEEHVGGKSRIRAGARHVARMTGIVRIEFAPTDDYLARVTRLEDVRERLAALEDTVTASLATFVVEDPDRHRAAVLERIATTLREQCEAFGLEVAELDTGVELTVAVRGPTRARLSLEVRAQLRRPRAS